MNDQPQRIWELMSFAYEGKARLGSGIGNDEACELCDYINEIETRHTTLVEAVEKLLDFTKNSYDDPLHSQEFDTLKSLLTTYTKSKEDKTNGS